MFLCSGPGFRSHDPALPAAIASDASTETVHAVTTGKAVIRPTATRDTAHRARDELRRSDRNTAAGTTATAVPCHRKWISAHRTR